MRSKFGTLSTQDFFKGLFIAFVTALLTGIYQVFQTTSAFDWPTLKPVLFTAIAAGLSYIIKNYLTNSQDQLMRTERYGAIHPKNSKTTYRTILLIGLLSSIGLATNAQVNIFKPVPKNLFTVNKSALNTTQNTSVWLWRLSANVTAVELVYNKTTKQFDSQALSSAGPAIGYRHYSALPDGSPYNDFGVNLAILLGTDIEHITPANIKPALLINAFQFVNVGIDYGIGSKTFGILLGASINF